MIRWLRNKGYSFVDADAFRGAASGGHLEVLKWLRSEGCPWDRGACIAACPFIPGAALAPEPLQYLQMTAITGNGEEIRIQLEPLQRFQPLQGLQVASARCEEEKKKSEAKATKRRRD